MHVHGKEWSVLEMCPKNLSNSEGEILGVETIVFKVIPIASFRMKPKDHGECGETLTDNDMFTETVWSSGMVSTTTGRQVVIQAMATVMHKAWKQC